MQPSNLGPYAARRGTLWLLAACLLALNGCAWFGGGERLAPTGFNQRYDAQRLTDPDTRAAGYRELFPERSRLWISQARLTVDRRWLPDLRPMTQYVSYLATDPGRVRLRVSNPHLAAPLIDVLQAGGWMTVKLAGERRAMFAGPVGASGSPFGGALGVEPGDVLRVFAIGERVWRDRWTDHRHWRRLELRPAGGASADGLERLDLDLATGLPRTAHWRRGREHWSVEYEGWGWFGDAGTSATTSLMPRRLTLRPDRPAVALTLEMAEADGYRFTMEITPKAFQPSDMPGVPIEPLERLAEPLRETLEQ